MASGAGGSGGGAGGGETPARRRHLRSFHPYRPGAHRRQGVLSWFTESVKNIVPRWLQSYFSRNEDVCTCSTDRREGQQGPENREDDHLISADEESANIRDGRVTPEPTVNNTEDPSRTTALNCLHIVMRPSLHRSHLNVSIFEYPSLNCQPSTSLAFPIASFEFSKEMQDSTSQDNDGNISTTSDLSSRASAKDTDASKNNAVPQLGFVENECCRSLSEDTATNFSN